MGRYLLKRLILFLPVVILILILLFFLIRKVSSYDVLKSLEAEDYSYLSAPNFAQRFEVEAKKKNYHLPSFYFSCMPRALYKTSEIDPMLYFREPIVSWLKERSFAQVKTLYARINQCLSDNSLNAEQQRVLNHLKSAGPETSHRWMDELRGWRHEYETIDKLVVFYEEMSADDRRRFEDGIPIIRWNGFQNQFHYWAKNLFNGNWGISEVDGLPVKAKIISSLKWTITLSFFTLLLAYLIGLPLGLWGAITTNTVLENLLSKSFFLFYAMPLFWIATLLIVFFTTDDYGQWSNIFPSVGILMTNPEEPFLYVLLRSLKFLVLPVICLTLGSLAFVYQLMRSNTMDETIRPYFLTARAKGLSRGRAVSRHAFINAVYPLVGRIGTLLPALVSGSIVIEVLFNIPGMGRLLMDSIYQQDWNTVLGITMLSAVVTFLGFVLTDILLYSINPKVRFEY